MVFASFKKYIYIFFILDFHLLFKSNFVGDIIVIIIIAIIIIIIHLCFFIRLCLKVSLCYPSSAFSLFLIF